MYERQKAGLRTGSIGRIGCVTSDKLRVGVCNCFLMKHTRKHTP